MSSAELLLLLIGQLQQVFLVEHALWKVESTKRCIRKWLVELLRQTELGVRLLHMRSVILTLVVGSRMHLVREARVEGRLLLLTGLRDASLRSLADGRVVDSDLLVVLLFPLRVGLLDYRFVSVEVRVSVCFESNLVHALLRTAVVDMFKESVGECLWYKN